MYIFLCVVKVLRSNCCIQCIGVLTPSSPISIDVVRSLANVLLPTEMTTEIDILVFSTSTLSRGQLIGIIIGGIVVLIIAMLTMIFLMGYIRVHHKHRLVAMHGFVIRVAFILIVCLYMHVTV